MCLSVRVLSFYYEAGGGAALPKVKLRPWPLLPAATEQRLNAGQQRDVYTVFSQDNHQMVEWLQAAWRGEPRAVALS